MSSRTLSLAGRILSGLFAAFMIGASVVPKLFLDVGARTMADLGWPEAPVRLIGLLELALTLLFLIPRTALFGATLLMALLGGALVTQMRADSPLFSHVLFSVYLGAAMWAGLWLRDGGLRRVWPLRRG